MAKPDYFAALNDVAAPVRGGEQSGLAAANAQGAAAVAGIEKTTDAVKFLGTTALEATVGYKQAGLQKEIEDTLNNTVAGSYVGKSAQDKLNVFNADRADALSRLQGKYIVDSTVNSAIVDNQAFEAVDAQTKGEFVAEVEKLRAGQLQGVFTRDQAINRIAALVKSYSADVPGLAQSFRQIAAEQTGVSNIDVLGIHNALTKQSVAEKQAAARVTAQLELDKAIASANGVALDAITPAMRNNWTSEKQGERAASQLETRLKTQGLVDTEVDKVHTQLATVKIMDSVGKIDKGFRALLETLPGTTMEDKLKSDASGIALEALISSEYTRLVQSVRGQTLRSADNPQPLRDDTKIIAGIDKQFDELRKAVKSAEGRQMFGQIIKAQEGQVSNITNSFLIANPGIVRMNQMGLKDSFAQVFAAQGFDYDKMKAQFGEGIANMMRQAVNDATGFQRAMTNAATNPEAVRSGQGVAPETNAAAITNAKQTTINQAGRSTPLIDPTAKNSAANYMATWGVGFNAGNINAVNEYYNFLTGNGQNYLSQFSPEQRRLMQRNFLVNIDKEIPKLTLDFNQTKAAWEENARALVADVRDNPGKKLDAKPVLSVVQDPYLAGALRVQVDWVGPDREAAIRMKVGVPDISPFTAAVDKMNKFAVIYSRSAKDITGGNYSDTQAYGVAAKMLNGEKVRFYPTTTTAPVPKNTSEAATVKALYGEDPTAPANGVSGLTPEDIPRSETNIAQLQMYIKEEKKPIVKKLLEDELKLEQLRLEEAKKRFGK